MDPFASLQDMLVGAIVPMNPRILANALKTKKNPLAENLLARLNENLNYQVATGILLTAAPNKKDLHQVEIFANISTTKENIFIN